VVILGVVGVFRLLSARRLHESRVPAVVVAVVCLLLATGTIARTREYQNGRTLAQVTVDRYPNGRARLALANEMVLAGDHQAALAELQAAVKDYPPALFGLATEMVTSGRLADAVTHAREFIRQVPDSPLVPAARDLMGRALVLQGEFEPAAEQFTLLAYARPNEPGPLASIGDVRLRQRRLQESINSYEGALRLRPGDPDILGQLGLAFAAAGRMSDASLAFGGAVTVRPTDLRLLSLLGRTLAAEGRYLDAVAPMRRVVELAPTDSQAVDNLAVMERLAARQQAAQPQAAQVARP
jgi:Flp pilus assembly protein TadD